MNLFPSTTARLNEIKSENVILRIFLRLVKETALGKKLEIKN